jgi:hypothetical protein
MLNFEKKYIFYFLFIFLSTNTLLFINDSVFWDDWVIKDQSYEILKTFYTNNTATGGHPYATLIHTNINLLSKYFNIQQSYLYRSIMLITTICNCLIILTILNNLHKNSLFAFIFVCLYITIPFNFAKIYVVITPYLIGNTFQLLSTLLFIHYIKNNHYLIKAIFLLTLFLSFQLLNSTILYLPVLFFIILIINKKKDIYLYLEVALLTLLFCFFKLKYYTPIGDWVNYNKISFKSILLSPLTLLKTFYFSFINLPFYCFSILGSANLSFPIFLLIFLVLYYFGKNIFNNFYPENIKIKIFKFNISVFLILGIVLFFAGSVAYNLVNHVPNFDYPSSRNQILLIYGSIFFIIHFLSLFVKKINHTISYNILFAFIFSIFITTTIISSIDSLRANLIQESISKEMTRNIIYKTNNNFIFYNNFNSKFWDESTRFYTFSGLNNLKNKNQNILIITDFEKNENINYFTNEYLKEDYKLKNVTINGQYNYKIYATFQKKNLSDLKVIEMIYFKFFKKNFYISELDNLLFFQYINI